MGKNCVGEETQDCQARKALGKGGVFRYQGEIRCGEEGVAQNTQGVKRKRTKASYNYIFEYTKRTMEKM